MKKQDRRAGAQDGGGLVVVTFAEAVRVPALFFVAPLYLASIALGIAVAVGADWNGTWVALYDWRWSSPLDAYVAVSALAIALQVAVHGLRDRERSMSSPADEARVRAMGLVSSAFAALVAWGTLLTLMPRPPKVAGGSSETAADGVLYVVLGMAVVFVCIDAARVASAHSITRRSKALRKTARALKKRARWLRSGTASWPALAGRTGLAAVSLIAIVTAFSLVHDREWLAFTFLSNCTATGFGISIAGIAALPGMVSIDQSRLERWIGYVGACTVVASLIIAWSVGAASGAFGGWWTWFGGDLILAAWLSYGLAISVRTASQPRRDRRLLLEGLFAHIAASSLLRQRERTIRRREALKSAQ